ncbi:MAG: acyl-CoA dehydrogenase family protein, partial [Candidatus Spechtbacterales bacterium]|nr:acyl-CoA dehydrogenase family protein [Candidatus Spechtbacterales bacterium]
MTKPIFQITETEEGLRKMMAEFGENELVPLSKSLATTHEFCAETYWQIRRQLGALGVLVMDIPSEYGGADAPGILACVPAEEVAAIDFGFSHQWVPASLVIPTIFYYGTEEQKKKWLPGLASGEMFGAYCQTEPDAGSDVSSIRCWAEQDENGDYILTGNTSKIFVSMGATDQSTPADVLLVMAKTSREGSPHKSLSMLLVDGKEAFQNGQLVVSKFEEKIGAHQTSTVELNFNNCKAELIGEPNKGFPIAMNALTASRVGVAVQATGIAKGAYRIAEKYATEQRTQFDRFIADLSAPAKYLEEMRAKIMISDLLSRRAITRKEQCPHKRGVDIV